MVKFKKNAFIALSAVAFGSAAYVGYREVTNDEASDLLLANVEALTQKDVVTDTGPGDTFKCEHCGVRVKICECKNFHPCTPNLCGCYH